MKFKTLLQKINPLVENAPEHTVGGGLFIGDPQGRFGPSALSDKGTFNIKLPHSIDAINAMLSAFSNRDYIDPVGVTSIVKRKLNHFGFDFMCGNDLNDGMNTFDLVQYGSPQLGVFGQNPYDDVNKKGFNQGDGIKEKLGHGLRLNVDVMRMPNGLRKLNMVITPSAGEYSYKAESVDNNCDCLQD
jgi:hypothetical protein